MQSFIQKHQYNYIKKCSDDLNNAFKSCTDINTIEVTKLYIYQKILASFTDLSNQEKQLLDITKITDPLHINKYLSDLNEYVYGMPPVTNAQIKKLFKKEKKLKLPEPTIQYSNNVYLGWIDKSIRKLFIVYNMDNKLLGMACRILDISTNNTNVCSICNHVGKQNEIAFVSPICKNTTSSKDYYRSIGFYVCLDSEKCNNRITSTDKLESIIKNVNNMR